MICYFNAEMRRTRRSAEFFDCIYSAHLRALCASALKGMNKIRNLIGYTI